MRALIHWCTTVYTAIWHIHHGLLHIRNEIFIPELNFHNQSQTAERTDPQCLTDR